MTNIKSFMTTDAGECVSLAHISTPEFAMTIKPLDIRANFNFAVDYEAIITYHLWRQDLPPKHDRRHLGSQWRLLRASLNSCPRSGIVAREARHNPAF